jgi:hypothetical protein
MASQQWRSIAERWAHETSQWVGSTYLCYRCVSAEDWGDIQSKVQELGELNQSLRNRDKMKDYAIAQLSDQLLAISTRLQELEMKRAI